MNANSSRTGRSGSVRLIIVLVLAMGAAFWYGGQGIYTALRNREPARLGMEQLSKGRPTSHWLVLTNAELAVYDAAWKITRSKYSPESGGRITEGYIPLRVPGQSLKDRCYAVLATKDSETLAMLEALRKVKGEEDMERFVASYKGRLKPTREVSGLVRFGIEKGSEAGKLAGLQSNLAPGFVVLSDGEKPDLRKSVVLLFVGFVIAGGMLMAWRSNRAETTGDLA